MPDYLKSIIEAGTKSATTTSSGTKMPSTTGKGEIPSNDVMKYLADRLQKQGEGISTSSSSDLQKEIEKAMQGTLAAGEASKQRILSERDREVGFAQDRGYATLVGAQESQTGYARQVAALHELNSTTEKSVRDLEGRYQEALLANDANTMSQYSGLIMKKLEFQQEQEQNFFSNVMSVANLQQSAIDSMMRREEFWAGQEQQENQFIASMSNSAYQFEQNMALNLKELKLKEEENRIAWDRNAISRAEMNARSNEIEKEKSKMLVSGTVFKDMRNEVMSLGKKAQDLDPSAYAIYAYDKYKTQYPNATFDDYFEYALLAKDEFVSSGLTPPPKPTPQRTGGVLNAFGDSMSFTFGPMFSGAKDFLYGKEVK